MKVVLLFWDSLCCIYIVAVYSQNICRYFSGTHLTGFRIAIGRKTFTPTNTGLDKQSEFPELGSTFKAAFVKACSWYFAKVAIEISEKNPAETFWHRNISFCSFLSYVGLYMTWASPSNNDVEIR
jgi:hypothetical protein